MRRMPKSSRNGRGRGCNDLVFLFCFVRHFCCGDYRQPGALVMSALHERELIAALVLLAAAAVIVRVRQFHARELERFRVHVRVYFTSEERN